MPSLSAVALRHVHFEDLGHLAAALADRDYHVDYCDLGVDSLAGVDPIASDLLIILGGPIGVYEQDKYPFLGEEVEFIGKRLASDRPTLGICLGSQLIANALGERVYPMGFKEIGYAPVALTPEGMRSPLATLGEDPVVLHWHGDTFDLPERATRLASTPRCANQAFTVGSNVLALQFHVEVPGRVFERWLIGHACELSAAGMDIHALRTAANHHDAALAARARVLLDAWLDWMSGPQ